jgi:hypothetical protein
LDDSPTFWAFDPNLEVALWERCKTGGKECADDDVGALGGGGGFEEVEEGFSMILPTSILVYVIGVIINLDNSLVPSCLSTFQVE